MSEIHIVRKVGVKASNGRIAKADKVNIRKRVGIISRVSRPAILDLFLGGETAAKVGGFFALVPASQADVKNPAKLALGEIDSFVVPASDLGRKGEATASQAESIRLWVTKHIVGHGICEADEVSVVFVSGE